MSKLISRAEYEANRPKHQSVFILKILSTSAFFAMPNRLRIVLYRAMGIKIGRGVFIGRNCIIEDNFPELITIEDGAQISSGTIIFVHDSSKPEVLVGPVVIKKDAYLGAGAIILAGVTIGERAIVGAGAVVTKDVEPSTVVAGVPASPLK
jgi:acetyltransferase-like isoleucine patch superfamily enzyme